MRISDGGTFVERRKSSGLFSLLVSHHPSLHYPPGKINFLWISNALSICVWVCVSKWCLGAGLSCRKSYPQNFQMQTDAKLSAHEGKRRISLLVSCMWRLAISHLAKLLAK